MAVETRRAKLRPLRIAMAVALLLALIAVVGPRRSFLLLGMLYPHNLVHRLMTECAADRPPPDLRRITRLTGLEFPVTARLVGSGLYLWEDPELLAHIELPAADATGFLQRLRRRATDDYQWLVGRKGSEPLWWDPHEDASDVYVVDHPDGGDDVSLARIIHAW